MRVRVTKEGFMFGSLQKVGTELTLEKDEHFSKNWMEKIKGVVEEVEIVINKAEAELEADKEPEPKKPKKAKVK